MCVLAQVRRERRVEVQEQKRKDKAAREESQKQKEARSYSTLMQVSGGPDLLLQSVPGRCVRLSQYAPACVASERLLQLECFCSKLGPLWCTQANSMTSSAQMAKKYSSAQEYEDDFM